eukprot:297061-Rhodomonas_salina.1
MSDVEEEVDDGGSERGSERGSEMDEHAVVMDDSTIDEVERLLEEIEEVYKDQNLDPLKQVMEVLSR